LARVRGGRVPPAARSRLALLAGITADAFGLPVAMWLVAAITFASGIIVAVRMRETLRPASSIEAGASP